MAATLLKAGQLHRCVIYARKSASVGLDKPLNSLELQRRIWAAHICDPCKFIQGRLIEIRMRRTCRTARIYQPGAALSMSG